MTETSSPARPQGEGAGQTGSAPGFETPALKRLLEAAAAREARSAPQPAPPAPEPPKPEARQPEVSKAAPAAERAPASWPEATDWFDQAEPAPATAQAQAAAARRELTVERRHAPTWPKWLQHPAVPISLIVVALAIAVWLMIFSA